MSRFVCPNGHPFPDALTARCDEPGCDGRVVVVPHADAIRLHEQLERVERIAKCGDNLADAARDVLAMVRARDADGALLAHAGLAGALAAHEAEHNRPNAEQPHPSRRSEYELAQRRRAQDEEDRRVTAELALGRAERLIELYREHGSPDLTRLVEHEAKLP